MTASVNVQCKPTPVEWIGAASGSVPANALLDEAGNPIKDENGNYILTD
jgi:hypothetical protein